MYKSVLIFQYDQKDLADSSSSDMLVADNLTSYSAQSEYHLKYGDCFKTLKHFLYCFLIKFNQYLSSLPYTGIQKWGDPWSFPFMESWIINCVWLRLAAIIEIVWDQRKGLSEFVVQDFFRWAVGGILLEISYSLCFPWIAGHNQFGNKYFGER